MRHREPVDAVDGERHAGHVKRRRTAEDVEPRQSHHQIDAGEELAEAGHPEAPQAHRAINLGAGLRVAEQRLAAPYEIARAETEEADGDRPIWRIRKRDCLWCHGFETPPLSTPSQP